MRILKGLFVIIVIPFYLIYCVIGGLIIAIKEIFIDIWETLYLGDKR